MAARRDHPTSDALVGAVKLIAQALVRVGATMRKNHPGGASDDLAAFLTQVARDVGDALAIEQE